MLDKDTLDKNETVVEKQKLIDSLVKSILDLNRKNNYNMDLVIPKDRSVPELGIVNFPKNFSVQKIQEMIGTGYKKIEVVSKRMTEEAVKLFIKERR